jgi:hypothetical protein
MGDVLFLYELKFLATRDLNNILQVFFLTLITHFCFVLFDYKENYVHTPFSIWAMVRNRSVLHE